MTALEKGYELLNAWRGEDYIHGCGVLPEIGTLTARYGKKVMLVSTKTYAPLTEQAIGSIRAAGGILVPETIVPGARPNAPKEDVYRIAAEILRVHPDVVISFGGGSTIDAVKAAIALAVLEDGEAPSAGDGKDDLSWQGGPVDRFFGTGLVTEALQSSGRKMLPHIAVETAASSGAHLTKYANITDLQGGQKMLIVDPAVVPTAALFDYDATLSMPRSVTIDGALDGISHTLEVFWGAKPDYYEKAQEIALTALELILGNAKKVLENPSDRAGREALGVATDLGGYAIMVGGTSGAHLTSFSLIDVTAHGTACGIMNPYYAVFYSPAIQEQLATIGEVLKRYGFMEEDAALLQGRARAEAVSCGMMTFAASIGAPTKLSELPSFREAHVARILSAAKKPELKMKLQNMPVPMTAEDVDPYMGPVIRAAVSGDLSVIVNK